MKKILTPEEVFKDCWIEHNEDLTGFNVGGEPRGEMVAVEIPGVSEEVCNVLRTILAKTKLDKYINGCFADGVLYIKYFEGGD